MIRVTLNEENVQRAEVLMKSCPKIVQRAAVNAINRTITSTRAEISKAVRGRYAVKAADVKKALSLTRAKGQSPRGVITASGSPLSLTKFSLRRRKRGPIRVRVLRNGELKPVSGLFLIDSEADIPARCIEGRRPGTRWHLLLDLLCRAWWGMRKH